MSDNPSGDGAATHIRGLTPLLKTEDLGATLAFYIKGLGFNLNTLDPEDEPTLAFLDFGSVHLGFYLDTEGRDPGPALTGQLYFDVEDATALHEHLSQHIEILWGPQVYDYGRREFAVRDPNGYVLTFGEPTTDAPDGTDAE